MKTVFKSNLEILWQYVFNFFELVFFSVIIGFLGGVLGSFFHLSIDFATESRAVNPMLLLLMPIGAAAIVLMYKLFSGKTKINTDLIISSLREDKKIPLVMIPLIFVSTVITQLVGGSAGREGAALQLGGSVGYNVGKLFRLNSDKTHVLIMTGMSAVFSALFGTPLTAALFSLEVASVGLIDYTALLPCAVSAITARFVAGRFGISPVSFGNVSFDGAGLGVMLKIAVLSVLCALLSIVFCVAIKKGTKLIRKILANDYLRAVVCSVVLVGATFLVGTYDYNGAGMNIVERAMGGQTEPFAFALKIAFTAVSIAAGFKGGEIVPAFFVGATFGCAVAPLLGLDPVLGAAIGFVSLFCGVVNCPIASIILSMEVFGASGILFFAVSCSISYMLSGYFSLYSSQRIVYSKSDAHYIES